MAALITFRRTNLVGQERWKSLIPLGDCPCQSFYIMAAGGGNKGGVFEILKTFPSVTDLPNGSGA